MSYDRDYEIEVAHIMRDHERDEYQRRAKNEEGARRAPASGDVAVPSEPPPRVRDIAAYGYCWCGEPRSGRVFYDTDTQQWWSTMVCYAGHGGMPEDRP